ncbi:metalloproteinase domain-containing protein [Bdellovibrio sp. BCCA]|uniref:metalloproteinase domain-containing protein n=1 Tax=Bdellovibrio sp. BCCA TaxID=3136281 RepID=UPI0030F24668
MRKSLIVLALPFLFAAQAQASAFDSLNDQKLQEQAYTLLENNADSIRMSGDVHDSERLSDILGKIKAYNDEILKRLEEGRDIENLESPISNVDTKCQVQQDEKSADCTLFISYRPMGETGIQFTVLLDAQKNAVDIIRSVLVSRGD